MQPDFETWAMRGLVVGLLAVLGTLIMLRWKGQDRREDEFHAALEQHRNSTEAALKDFRTDFMSHLDKLRSSNETALMALNQTIAGLAQTAGEIRARMAERYATKEELAMLEERLGERIQQCQKCGG